MRRVILPLLLGACTDLSETEDQEPRIVPVVLHRIVPESQEVVPDEVISRVLADEMLERANLLYEATGFKFSLQAIVDVPNDAVYFSDSDGALTWKFLNEHVRQVEDQGGGNEGLNVFSLPRAFGKDLHDGKIQTEEIGGFFNPIHPSWVTVPFKPDANLLSTVFAHEVGHLAGLVHRLDTVMCTNDKTDYSVVLRDEPDCPDPGSEEEIFEPDQIKKIRNSNRLNHMAVDSSGFQPMPPQLSFSLGCEEGDQSLTSRDISTAVSFASDGATIEVCRDVIGGPEIVLEGRNLSFVGRSEQAVRFDSLGFNINDGNYSFNKLTFEGQGIYVDSGAVLDFDQVNFIAIPDRALSLGRSRVSINGCVFQDNGSAISAAQTIEDYLLNYLSVTRSDFIGNRQAIYGQFQYLSVISSQFFENEGLIEVRETNLTSANNLFMGNHGAEALISNYSSFTDAPAYFTSFRDRFYLNSSHQFGGSVVKVLGPTTIVDDLFSGNEVSIQAVSVVGTADITNTEFRDTIGSALSVVGVTNIANTQFVNNGGGKSNFGAAYLVGRAHIADTSFEDNRGLNVGALDFGGDRLTIARANFIDNLASASSAISISGPEGTVFVDISDTNFSGNRSQLGEGYSGIGGVIDFSTFNAGIDFTMTGGVFADHPENSLFGVDIAHEDHPVSAHFFGVNFVGGKPLRAHGSFPEDLVLLEACSFEDGPICELISGYVNIGVCENSPID